MGLPPEGREWPGRDDRPHSPWPVSSGVGVAGWGGPTFETLPSPGRTARLPTRRLWVGSQTVLRTPYLGTFLGRSIQYAGEYNFCFVFVILCRHGSFRCGMSLLVSTSHPPGFERRPIGVSGKRIGDVTGPKVESGPGT